MKFRPLEETMEKLEKYAKAGDRKPFVQESARFYAELGTLSRYGHGINQDALTRMVRQYETRYEQLKFILRTEKTRDVGQVCEGSD